MIALAVDAILVLVLFEGATLVLLRQRTGRGIPSARLIANLAAGFSLMLALRLALAGAPAAWLALCLLAALLAHVADLAQGWRE